MYPVYNYPEGKKSKENLEATFILRSLFSLEKMIQVKYFFQKARFNDKNHSLYFLKFCHIYYQLMHRLAGTIRLYLSSISKNIQDFIEVKNDKYNAIHVTLKQELEPTGFNEYINDLIKTSPSKGTTSIWVHLQGRQLALVSDLINDKGFSFHRGSGKKISLYRWMSTERKDMVVPYSMFHVGCGGVIINNGSILLIQEKRGDLKGRYGVPGGRADAGQGLKQCSEREVFQEVGIKSSFSNVLWLRQLSNYVYGSYDYYFACLMNATPQALKQMKVCDYEIEKAIWMPLKEYLSFSQVNSFGTQLEMAKYIHSLYEQGYDFANPPSNFSFKWYNSPIDQKKRFFAQHRLAQK